MSQIWPRSLNKTLIVKAVEFWPTFDIREKLQNHLCREKSQNHVNIYINWAAHYEITAKYEKFVFLVAPFPNGKIADIWNF